MFKKSKFTILVIAFMFTAGNIPVYADGSVTAKSHNAAAKSDTERVTAKGARTSAKADGKITARMVPVTGAANTANVPEKAYVEGFGDNTFRPDRLLTKAEFARIISNVYGTTNAAGKVGALGVTSRSSLPGSYTIRDRAANASPRPGAFPGRGAVTGQVGTAGVTDNTNTTNNTGAAGTTDAADTTKAQTQVHRENPETVKTWAQATTPQTRARTIGGNAHWGHEFMENLFNKGYVARPVGDEFNPDEHVLREDFVAVLSKIKGYNVVNQIEGGAAITRAEAIAFINTLEGREKKWDGAKKFKDVHAEHWAYDDIMNAANGYTL